MKRGVILIVCLVMIGGLLGVLFYLEDRPANEEGMFDDTPDTTVALIERERWDIKSVRFVSDDSDITLLPLVDEPEETDNPESDPPPTPIVHFTVFGFEEAILDATAVDNMARLAFSLTADEMITNTGDPSEFGLDPPEAKIVVKYADGTEKTILVGIQTPAGDFYYMMIEGEPEIYILGTSIAERAFFGKSDILNKRLPQISAETLSHVYIRERGREPIEFAFDGSEEEKELAMLQFGGLLIHMVQPFEGLALYNSSFQRAVLDGMTGISIGDLVEARPEDYSIYGFDDPSLVVLMRDVSGELHLVVGDEVTSGVDSENGATYVYVKFYDRPSVFKMDKAQLFTLYNVNILDFTARFVALVNIDDVDEISIVSTIADYDISLNHVVVPAITPTLVPNQDSEGEDTPPAPPPAPERLINPEVNGQAVQDAAFRSFYQSLIGLSFDTIIEVFTPDTDPETTITFRLNTGEPDVVVRYFGYNYDFYAVQKGEEPIRFAVGKRFLEYMFVSMDDLLAGYLDR